MVSAPSEYFKGTPCGYCRQIINDGKAIALHVDDSSGGFVRLLHSGDDCRKQWFEHGEGVDRGRSASWDTVELSERPTFEDFVERSFHVATSPKELADKLVQYSNDVCRYEVAKVDGADPTELAKLNIDKSDISTVLLLYSGKTWLDLGKVIEDLKTAPTFGAEALLIQRRSNPDKTYVIPFFKEPITPETVQGLGVDVAK